MIVFKVNRSIKRYKYKKKDILRIFNKNFIFKASQRFLPKLFPKFKQLIINFIIIHKIIKLVKYEQLL